MWIKIENGESIKPQEIEQSGSNIIVRRRFRRIAATEEMPEHWEYEEWQMSAEQYEVYQDFEVRMQEQSDALVELAEIIGEVM